jgi:hypothetical protein
MKEKSDKAEEMITLGVNPMGISILRAKGYLGFRRNFNDRAVAFTPLIIDFNRIVQSLVDPCIESLDKFLESNHQIDRQEFEDIRRSCNTTLVDVTGRALYARLRYIDQLVRLNAARFNERPSFNKEISLPRPIAQAITNIGIISPQNVLADVKYCPTINYDVQHTGGIQQLPLFPAYMTLRDAYLKPSGLLFDNVSVRDTTGTYWWTLRSQTTQAAPNNFRSQIIAALPPSNYSDTDVIAFATFSVRPEHTVLQANQQGLMVPQLVAKEWNTTFIIGAWANNFGILFDNLLDHHRQALFMMEAGTDPSTALQSL